MYTNYFKSPSPETLQNPTTYIHTAGVRPARFPQICLLSTNVPFHLSSAPGALFPQSQEPLRPRFQDTLQHP